MNSLMQSAPAATTVRSLRERYAAWSALTSGGSTIATILVVFVLAPLLGPTVAGAVIVVLPLILFLGMIPIALLLGDGSRLGTTTARMIAGGAMTIGIVGVLAVVAKSLLDIPHALAPVAAYELETSALGAVGLWLLAASPLATHDRFLSRALAIVGVIAGIGWFLPAAAMWAELSLGDAGGLTPALEGIRLNGSVIGALVYTIWAFWLGFRLVRRTSSPGTR